MLPFWKTKEPVPFPVKQKRQLGGKSNKLSKQIPTVVLENQLNWKSNGKA
uniref:Uncharacterized protein n=1 Tax=Romanomermis culicivorax TaxID=13658 RepID=A0A915JM09_ROMCU